MALNSNTQGMSSKDLAATRYRSSRINLLLVFALTTINIILAATVSDTYFPFSATIPYYLALEGAFITGRFPADYYEAGAEFMPDTVFYVMVGIAAVMTIAYLLCYLCSGKGRYGWMVAALVFFLIDTVAMFLIYGIDTNMLINIVFHVYIVISLINGIKNGSKLKKLSVEPIYPINTPDVNTQL